MTGLRRRIAGATEGLPRAFWFLWASLLVSQLGSFVILFMSMYLTRERGFSASFAGLVVGLAFGGGGMVGTLAGGFVADFLGRRRTMLTGNLVTVVCMVALGYARDHLTILVLAVAVGTASNMVRPAAGALMVDLTEPKDRPRAFSLQFWAVNLGFSVAGAMAGFLIEVDFTLLFLLDAATTLVAALLVYFCVPEPRPAPSPSPADAGEPAEKRGTGMALVLRDRSFLALVGLAVLFSVVFMQHMSTLPLAVQNAGLPPATYGWLIALNGIAIVVGQLFVPRLISGRRPGRVLALAAVLMGGGFGLLAVGDSLAVFIVSVLIWTAGEMLNASTGPALAASLAPDHMRGRYQGFFTVSYNVAGLVGPSVGGYVLQHGGSALWLGCLALGALTGLGHLAAGAARERGAARPQPAREPAAPTA
ncbi:MFS transporter [Streptomyces sp. SID14515]|uniref:MDR family MFS transporter n=1 Tax=Streptomyces sp. SID14515 TaxID=2706074 RepID=UPI0013C9C247|nr:MFS transporter [Streptomyces sp. SID14515]NEB39619.1 MFS transporter [Streptomyces sp. SID14515]